MCHRRVPIAVQEVQTCVAAAQHSLHAAFVPPAVGPGHVISAVAGLVLAARSEQIAESVVIRAAAPACFGLFQVAESAKGHRYIIRFAFVVKVSVASVLKVAVVYPCVGHSVKAEQVPAVAVVCAGAHKSQIAQNDIF